MRFQFIFAGAAIGVGILMLSAATGRPMQGLSRDLPLTASTSRRVSAACGSHPMFTTTRPIAIASLQP